PVSLEEWVPGDLDPRPEARHAQDRSVLNVGRHLDLQPLPVGHDHLPGSAAEALLQGDLDRTFVVERRRFAGCAPAAEDRAEDVPKAASCAAESTKQVLDGIGVGGPIPVSGTATATERSRTLIGVHAGIG